MDASNNDTGSRRVSRSTHAVGGKVEPANRVELVRAQYHTPVVPPDRYELYDPFAEVTYRSKNIHEIEAKAEQLGASRFTAVEADGRRSVYEMVAGEWMHRSEHPLRPERWLDLSHERDDESPPRQPAKIEVPAAERAATPANEHTAPAPAAAARIEADAERAALVARLEAALGERYVIKQAPVHIGDAKIVGRTEYRFRGDTSRVAFTESNFRLATDTNSPSVARSMVDVAQARGWSALRVSGHEEFKRLVWLEASVRGVKTIGYEPVPGDLEVLRREREARQVNRIEPDAPASPAAAGKASARGSGGRKTVLAAIEAVLVAQRVPEKRREAIMTAAADNLAKRLAAGEVHKVKVYDKAAPQQRPAVRPAPEQQRTRERAAPAPVR